VTAGFIARLVNRYNVQAVFAVAAVQAGVAIVRKHFSGVNGNGELAAFHVNNAVSSHVEIRNAGCAAVIRAGHGLARDVEFLRREGVEVRNQSPCRS